jgi:aerobic-type carbon monoxide dehydrogenase small subunit (CoxS/CutS family)
MPEDRRAAQDPSDGREPSGVSRRSFIQTVGVSAAVTSAFGETGRATPTVDPGAAGVPMLGPGPIDVTLRVNGKPLETRIDPATTLVEALRLDLGLTGTKEVCDRGACGGCSVMVDGRLTASCMMLAVDAIDREITTVEGIADGDVLDPVQTAFIRHDALQCGFCTPGLVVAVRALLDENPKPTLDEIKQGLSGNICRCGTYTNVFNAVLDASGQAPLSDPGGRVR